MSSSLVSPSSSRFPLVFLIQEPFCSPPSANYLSWLVTTTSLINSAALCQPPSSVFLLWSILFYFHVLESLYLRHAGLFASCVAYASAGLKFCYFSVL